MAVATATVPAAWPPRFSRGHVPGGVGAGQQLAVAADLLSLGEHQLRSDHKRSCVQGLGVLCTPEPQGGRNDPGIHWVGQPQWRSARRSLIS